LQPLNNYENNEIILNNFCNKIYEAADATIPLYIPTRFFPKPWWSLEVQKARDRREKAYQKYRRNKSLNNFIEWKRARAKFKFISKKSKKESWIKLTTTLNQNTPTSKIYQIIRKIKGNKERVINMLSENDTIFSTKQEIANKLGQTFSNISSTNNYSATFQQYRTIKELEYLDFTPNINETYPYNEEFSIEELQYALDKTRNTSPGPDGIIINMIKKLPENALLYHLEILNKFYKENYFPRQWRKATIIPIPKPNKNHNNPNNYRPIALTSVICKTMERIINERLLDWLNMTKKLNTIQCGARKFRSTTDHLIRLETMIRHTFAHNEHVISIFFDLEKAYDTTWKYGIMNDLHRKGFRGLLPKFIDEFLKDRTFNVKVGNILSDTFKQETGVPQGSVLSVTLFMIKVDQLAEMIPAENRFMSSLFVDDLQISYSHSDLNIIKQKMQTCLNNITQWSNKNGYKFSIAKTNAIHFNTIRGLHLKPDLYLDNQKLNCVENAKFLGIIWDEKLTWRPHLLNLKANCQKLLGLMRSISSLTWGADQNTLKLVYIAYIRSKLDYGSIIYASAHKTNLQIIDSIANEALRISTGAFKSTPIESIYILANEIPLNMRRNKLSLQY
jgi:hypothetical protein